MSENEKRKRLNYKKNRKKWIIIQSVILLVVTVALAVCMSVYYALNKTYYIGYTENGYADYTVNYKKSEEYGEQIAPGQSYISSLVESVLIDFQYGIKMDTADVNYDYSYRVDAVLEIFDDNNKLPVYNPVFSLVPVKKFSQSSNNNLLIAERVSVDFVEYNKMASDLIRKYQLRDVTSNLKVKMTVDVTGNSDSFEESANNNYTQTVNIPLTETTFRISSSESVPSGMNKVLACRSDINRDVFKISSIVLASLLVILLIILIAFIYLTRNDDINYAIKVRRLVSAYSSYIQKITNPFDEQGYQILNISSFSEMLGIRDTIQSPILMHENEDQTSTKFIIPTPTKIIYEFEIRVDNYDELYGIKEEPSVDEEPAVTDVETAPEAELTEATPEAEPVAEAAAAPEAEITLDTKPGEQFSAEGNGDDGVRLINGEVVHIRYRTSFMARLIRSGEKIQDLYSALKNELLSYADVKARTSWDFESFNKGRLQLAKLNVKGAAIHVCLALNPAEYNAEKYFFTDVSNKPKLEKVPMMLKVKGSKGLRLARELIAEVMNKNGIVRANTPEDSYRMPYESTEALVDRGLVKIILPSNIKIDENTVIEKLNVTEHIKSQKDRIPTDFRDVEILDTTVSEEELAEAISEPIAELSEIDFVDEIDEEYVQTEGHPGVEVIGVVWPERAHKNKVYRYDPNGERVEEEDVVLVPTRDAAKNKEFIRQARVVHANHLVDPDTLMHPLKKIIGVVRKKLEDALSGSSEK